jgi:hypothetical protein
MDKILEKYKAHAQEPMLRAKNKGAIIAIGGGGPCPFCDVKCNETEKDYDIAVCSKNIEHIIQWLPWGG